jgi:hypothetical protein
MLGIRLMPRVLPAVFSLVRTARTGQGHPGLISHGFSSNPHRQNCKEFLSSRWSKLTTNHSKRCTAEVGW